MMINGFSLPPPVAACLAEFDGKSTAFSEISVFGAIKAALDGPMELTTEDRAASYAEMTAFNLYADDAPSLQHPLPRKLLLTKLCR